ncbi:hypothetical protein NEOLEDRAFT_1178750 [Neolentinus lepideus HHB14362 ss-1]|uniref:Protein kinase domain-containing protein n=1 Tax=Neolentinus lepideus HHB14362 ss-1 TaxID=1314782 RepID=A0A165SD70_9AGAM|nr:hypothetical protein NEOLEDRAFT_1178750 [Neolentinus lepideus HHB14362 ss-1]
MAVRSTKTAVSPSSYTSSRKRSLSTSICIPPLKKVTRPRKKQRVDASIYVVRSVPDPRYTKPEVLASARAFWDKKHRNPLWDANVYGRNPYDPIWKDYKQPDPLIHHLPLPVALPPKLKRLHILPEELSCVEVVCDGGREEDDEYAHVSSVFKVRYKGQVYILKVFRSTDGHGCLGARTFTREKQAYESLLHYGVCSAGFAPICHGWFKLRIPDEPAWLKSYASDPKPAFALLIEFIPDAVQLDSRNITVPVAANAMLALEHVHGAGVLHSDLYGRNHLVHADGRVVIIDFGLARTWPHENVNRLSLKWEKEICWDRYFGCLLPDKLIGVPSFIA